MSRGPEPVIAAPARSWDTSVPTLVISVVAAVVLPLSRTLSGISTMEQRLASAILPLLVIAVAMAVAAVAATCTGNHGRSGFFGVLSLVLVNVAGLLSGQYGVGQVGLLVTLVVTAPFAIVMGRRETAWRQGRRCAVKS